MSPLSNYWFDSLSKVRSSSDCRLTSILLKMTFNRVRAVS